MDEQLERAKADALDLVRAHPELVLDDELPALQGCTNRVFFGRHNGDPVVVKCFCNAGRKEHEKLALQRLHPTGVVPGIRPIETETILVTDRLPGTTLLEIEPTLTGEQIRHLYYEIGAAFAKITAAGEEASESGRSDVTCSPGIDLEFYRTADLSTFYAGVLKLAAEAFEAHDIPEKEALEGSLETLRRERDDILAFPSFIHQDDVHANNVIVNKASFQGFIDLEMSRYGNEILLLGTVLAMCRNKALFWPFLRQGYEDTRGTPLDARTLSLAQHAATFSAWIRFGWYWGTDDLPDWAVRENARQKIVDALVSIIVCTDRIMEMLS